MATPGRLRQLVEDNSLRLDSLSTLVFDEADTLFDRSCGFMEDLQAAGVVPRPASNPQVLLVGATMGEFMTGKLSRKFPDLEKVVMPTLHTTASSLRTSFVDVGAGDKIAEIINLLRSERSETAGGDGSGRTSTIVFCNSISSCRAVDHAVNDAGLSAAVVHGDIPANVGSILP